MKLKVKRGRIYGKGREPIAYGDWEIRDGYRIIATFKNRRDALNAAHHLATWELAA